MGYSSLSKAYRFYNYRLLYVEESVHVAFDETTPQKSGKGSSSYVSGLIMENLVNNDFTKEDPPPPTEENIIKDKEGRIPRGR